MELITQVVEVALPEWQDVTDEQFAELLGAGVIDIPLISGGGYGGATTWSGQSKDNCLYAVLCIEPGGGQKFGTYAMRMHPDGRREWIQLLEFTETRVTVSEEPPTGVFLTWLAPGDRVLKRAQLPGFVPPVATGVAQPISVVPTAPGGQQSSSGVDKQAREYTTSVKKELEGKLVRAEARIAELEKLLGDLERRINHHVWDLVVEKQEVLYAALARNNPGVVGQIRRIVDER